MEPLSFSIRGDNGDHVSFMLDEVLGFPDRTSHWGGYDVLGTLSIRAGGFQASGELWTSTGEIYAFATSLKAVFGELKGEVAWMTYEHNLRLRLSFSERGRVATTGSFQEHSHIDNILSFSFEMDQSFLLSVLNELDEITARYGGPKGVNG